MRSASTTSRRPALTTSKATVDSRGSAVSPDPGFTCAEQRKLTEESGCIDEAEAALECGQNADFDSLTCEDDLLAELSKCEEPGTAWNECVGG